ncbi:MAG: ABC transporter permease [Planctomycetes bacterium]|nr:ABC transporter permease [Planctomycetota bacterium]
MYRFAWSNLLSKKLRSGLALIGLSIAIVGVVSLISVSAGLKASVSQTLSMIEGLVVLKRDSMDPILSKLPEPYGKRIAAIPGVRAVVPEVWELAPSVNGQNTLAAGLMSALAIFGVDPAERARLSAGGVYSNRKNWRKGRFLEVGDAGRLVVVISQEVARRYKKDVGDALLIGKESYEIIGIYETGAKFLDVALILPMDVVRSRHLVRADVVSNFYVELSDRSRLAEVKQEIERVLPDVDAKDTAQWNNEFNGLVANLDLFLIVVSSIAVMVGTVGILNTMLMSVLDRVAEFGILRANGWTAWDVMRLVLFESFNLGAVGGLLGCAVGYAGVLLVGRLLPLQPVTPWWLLAGSFGLAILLGVLGGLYPAARAARMNPIDAIRFI